MGQIRENLQHNLSYYLSLKEMSQKTLAEKLSVSQSAVTNWIKGKNAPDIETVAQICHILNISVLELFGSNINDTYTNQEKQIIEQYRKKIDMQKAVRILLDVKDE